MDSPKEWKCPNCEWVERAHPKYGWDSHNDCAVEIHQSHFCRARDIKCLHKHTGTEPEPGFSGPVSTLIVCYDCGETLGHV